MEKISWKELIVSEEEKVLAEEIRNGGAGKKLSEEELNRFPKQEEWDIEVDTAAGKTVVHMYRPLETAAGEKLPLFINLHGGGFVKGRRDQDIVFSRNFCSRSGVVVADIDYIPSPTMRFPGQVYACYDILQYFGANAETLGLDPERIAMGGHSAGGNLTAAAILMAIDQGTFVPKLQILDYPGLDMATPALEKRNGDSNPKIPAWKSDFYNKMYVDPEDAKNPYCSPAFATDAQLEKMPDTVLLYCDNDVFCDESEVFVHRLEKLGVTVLSKRFFHSNHGFVVQRKDEFEYAEKLLLAALATL